MSNIIIAGSRGFTNYEKLCKTLDNLTQNVDDITIVCGMARGADLLGKKYAEERGYTVIEMPAEWDKYGKSAGYKRNEEMAKIADYCVVFWDGKSKGSKHMIDLAINYDIPLRIRR